MQEVTIHLALTKLDALTVLSALEDGVLSWRLQRDISTGHEREYADLRARTLRARANEIIDALYPESYDPAEGSHDPAVAA